MAEQIRAVVTRTEKNKKTKNTFPTAALFDCAAEDISAKSLQLCQQLCVRMQKWGYLAGAVFRVQSLWIATKRTSQAEVNVPGLLLSGWTNPCLDEIP